MCFDALYVKCKQVVDSIPSGSMLFRQRYMFRGLESCIEKGTLENIIPEYGRHRGANYYTWVYWHKYSTLIGHKEQFAGLSLREYYQLVYITTAMEYLRRLKVVR